MANRRLSLSPLQYLFQVIFKTSSRLFRDILQTMSYASRSHRGRDRKVTVLAKFQITKVMLLIDTPCGILPQSPLP